MWYSWNKKTFTIWAWLSKFSEMQKANIDKKTLFSAFCYGEFIIKMMKILISISRSLGSIHYIVLYEMPGILGRVHADTKLLFRNMFVVGIEHFENFLKDANSHTSGK